MGSHGSLLGGIQVLAQPLLISSVPGIPGEFEDSSSIPILHAIVTERRVGSMVSSMKRFCKNSDDLPGILFALTETAPVLMILDSIPCIQGESDPPDVTDSSARLVTRRLSWNR